MTPLTLEDAVAAGAFEPDLSLWDAWRPEQVAALLADVQSPWYVAAGWAIDLFLGEERRVHEDLEIAVPRERFSEIAEALAGYELFIPDGDLTDPGLVWPFSQAPRALDAHQQTWVREPASGRWRLDVFREPSEGDTWIYRRDERIRLPYSQVIERTDDGIPYARPEIVLLFKAKHSDRPKDEADLAAVLPSLGPAAAGGSPSRLRSSIPATRGWSESRTLHNRLVTTMRLYSTLARDLVELPDAPGPIGMYVCGPTVYARAHIGNARPYVIAAWYKRWLRERGYDVTLVHNITDVNDKIYEAAPGASAARADEATRWYLEDTGRFGLDEVDHWPKVTEMMDPIIRFIEELVERGFAYEVDGDVYFRVSRWQEYGRLSGQKPDQVEEQEPNPRKEDPRDFALWKANKPDEDTWWDSPWGRGRPGWHIECSAMAAELLGPVFEIHGGGLDLVFPHHENELAQSRARGHEFAKLWMHNGMLRFTGEKMSKSLGNIETIQEVLDEWGRETVLLFFLTAHWRSPIDFSDETMAAAQAQWRSFQQAVYENRDPAPAVGWEAFEAALDDDFNTAQALAVLHEWRASSQLELLQRGLEVFGLGFVPEPPPEDVQALVAAREAARAAKDFAASDELRDRIAELGWVVQDTPTGSVLVPK